MTRSTKCLAALVLALFGAGCSLIAPEGSPAQMYTLSPQLPAAVGEPAVSRQITVAFPQMSPALATARIALTHGNTFDYYADAQWPDATPGLLQGLMVHALESSGALGKVAKDTEGIRSDAVVQAEVEAFQAHYATMEAAPVVDVEITLKLVQPRNGQIVAARSFREESPAATNSVPAVVQAFDNAMTRFLAEAAEWTLANAAAMPANGH